MSDELWGAATLTALFLFVVGVAELWARSGRGSPELTRKLVHFGGGLVSLLFPFLVHSLWTVAAMACALALFFGAGERWDLLTCLNRVARKSGGSQYYPFAILGVFYFSEGAPWLFIPSVLVLALADAGAALVGGRFGRIRYTVDFDTKSLEGSLVFFFLALGCLAIPPIYLSTLPVGTLLLSATLVALLATGVEAVSRDGRDNIFVPLAACLILKRISSKPPFEILYQNISLLLLVCVMAMFAWRSRAFNVGGTLTAILFCYASWSLGSEIWAVPVFLASVAFILVRRSSVEVELVRTGLAVSALVLPFCILLLANATDRYDFWFGPFVMAAVGTLSYAQLKVTAAVSTSVGSRSAGYPLNWAAASGAWGVVAVPSWCLQASTSVTLLIAMLIISLATTVLMSAVAERVKLTRMVRQLVVAGTVAAVVVLQLLGVDPWRPRTESLAMDGNSSARALIEPA